MSELKRPETGVNLESIKPKFKEITEFYTQKVDDYRYSLKQLNEYADALENEISVLKETPKVEVLLDDMDKQLYEVPRLVADYIDNKKLIDIAKSYVPINILEWLDEQTGCSDFDICVSHLIRIKAIGYTVKEEQMFYLREKNTGYYLDKNKKNSFLKLVINPYFDEDNKFTQSEIDELNIGSYEQIAVKADEV